MSVLPFLQGRLCNRCGRPLLRWDGAKECSECTSRETYFDGGVSIFEFGGIIQTVVYRLKFDGDREAAGALGKFMASGLKGKDWDIDAIMPVPLHEQRLAERGYNQSYLLAMEIGRECGIDVLDGVLSRIKHTESQTSLSRLERMKNVKDAFMVMDTRYVRGKSILIVDDIMTTGSTLNECSKVLKYHGADKVHCITAACPYHVK